MSQESLISFFRGEDILLQFAMDPVVDITGWTLSMKVADQDGTVQFTKAGTVTSGSAGTFTMTIDSADTAALTVGGYKWDVRRTDTGAKATLANGELDLKQEIVA